MPRIVPIRRRRIAAGAPIISPVEDKLALIEHHASRRVSHPHGSKMAMYLGVTICAVVVVAGWAMTTGRTLFVPDRPDPTITAITNSASIFSK
ncbi:MAG: hypothetical protein WCK01_01155 [Candidatus Uhrbacteria bacterium]